MGPRRGGAADAARPALGCAQRRGRTVAAARELAPYWQIGSFGAVIANP
jgi:hypothetical protein